MERFPEFRFDLAKNFLGLLKQNGGILQRRPLEAAGEFCGSGIGGKVYYTRPRWEALPEMVTGAVPGPFSGVEKARQMWYNFN